MRRKETEKHEFIKVTSLVRTSDKLFESIALEVGRVFPHAPRWDDFMYALYKTEGNKNWSEIGLSSPRNGRDTLSPSPLFIEEVDREKVTVNVMLPMSGGTKEHSERVVDFLLAHAKLPFTSESTSIVVKISLPFVPVEVHYDGEIRNDKVLRAFIHPEEVVRVW